MKRKYIIFLMYVLTSVCLFSIGFSSWTIVQNATVSTTGNIEASDMFNYDDFIYFDGDIQGFKYCSTCFLNQDLSKAEYGTCTVNLKINKENCAIQYYDNGGYDSIRIEVEFKFKDTNSDVFNMFASEVDIDNRILLNNVLEPDSKTPVQNGSYKVTFEYTDYLKDYRSIVAPGDTNPSDITPDTLVVQVHFKLTDEQFATAYDSFANMNFECIVRIEGC